MHLSKKDCELYYQHQVGGNYFQGSPYQRGYGFFGDLRRYITPLALRAGKYLGNHLLRTGKNVVHDVAGRTSFKDSARNRLRETSKQIKDDFFRKLQEGKGILHYDLAAQPKILVNGVNVRIKLERQKDPFSLMASGDNYKICLKSACLFIRKINVAASVVLAQEKALELGLIKMPIRRAEVRSFALSSGLQSSTIANAFIGQLPSRLILAFVSNEAYNGNFGKNPFNFQNYNLNYLSVLEGSKMIPSKPFQPNFANNLYARSYLSLFTDLNRFHNSQNININYGEYSKGYTMYAIDLTPDMAGGETHMSINRTGNIAIDIKFGVPLPETVSLIAYAEYRNTIEIDKARNVFTDF
ncbi:uncharacterized protein F54H12.2 [Trichonephila clavipes]|uniref:Uncharacterized protein F54H12.2 n=1 Tax=Trichonephila clavipes TaxID=2585209 RepID=A0A8X6S3D7_TRICX|nr:uncharacterized protein F54H12.2 [Trichonephila clavipes]